MRLILWSIAEIALSLLVIYTLVFLAFAVVPIDPARAVLGPNAPEPAVARLREDFGLQRPLPVRYWMTLRRMLVGDFGTSFYLRRPAREVVLDFAPRTLGRAAIGLLGGAAVGLMIGRLTRRDGRRVLRVILVFLQSIPSFCLVLVLLWTTARLLGRTPLGSPGLYELLAVCGAAAYPAGAIGLFVLERTAPAGAVPRHVEFLEMLGAPPRYIHNVLWKESVPGAIAIGINAVGIALTAVFFGELIFGIRGFGLVFIRSVERGDLSIVIAGSMLLSLVVVTVQKAGDVVLRLVDPRISRD